MANPASQRTARSLKVVTPHASNSLPDGIAEALWINDDATVVVAVVAKDDTDAVLMRIVGPGLLVVRTKAVRVTGTTATDIIAIY